MAARRRVETEFSLPLVARRYEELYQQHLAVSIIPERSLTHYDTAIVRLKPSCNREKGEFQK